MKIWRAFGRATVEPTEFIEIADGRPVVAWKITGEGNLSGLNLTLAGYAVATVGDGKLRGLAVYATRADALKAVGLAE